jgi:hypothetical protein
VVEGEVAGAEAPSIEVDHMPTHGGGDYKEVDGHLLGADGWMRAWASRYARAVYERCGRNKRRTCQVLQIRYHTLEAYLRVAGKMGRGHGKRLPRWVRTMSTPQAES